MPISLGIHQNVYFKTKNGSAARIVSEHRSLLPFQNFSVGCISLERPDCYSAMILHLEILTSHVVVI
jgi:hypothetical protein